MFTKVVKYNNNNNYYYFYYYFPQRFPETVNVMNT